ncbi:hypothetical protein CCACVL1_17802 [Corchorus capsularis]|uniref:Zinc finger, PHD-type n=1 Tax=Corchorus capsularis TaxID=210143 RepID=A0A1R3HQ94_COCAP|nr:hypothetical protein CCACVL1_17802 [Corchorus capsularis]
MESNSSKSGSSTKVDGASSSKGVSTTAKGSTSLSSAKADSNCSRSSAKEIGINKVASPSHSSSGKKTSIKGSDTNDRFVSCFGKVSSSFRYEKVMLVSPQGDHGSCSIKKKQVAVHEDKTSDRTSRDARSYKEWLKSRISKRKMSETNGKRSVTSAEACKENKEEVIEGHFSCSKRQRVDFDSKQESYSCNAEPGNISPVQFAFLTELVSKKELHVHVLGNSKESSADEKELISELNADQAEEYFSDTLDKGFQLEKKIGRKQDTCVTCLLGGKLLCCVGKGCKRSFHLSCLVPALSDNPPGLWHCIWCVKKKKELGVHSVSEVESIWDARDVVSDDKALKHEKQYLVKYRGLAHVHNRWIPETKLLSEAPALVTKYNSKNQVTSWKKEWTVPHRLLQKRKLLFPTNSDENNIDCSSEWLVKWIGLGYEQATWELENSSFLMSPEAMKLIRDFEIRHQKSERLTSHSEEEEKERCNVSDLSQLSFGGSPGEYDCYQNYVNKLLAYWHKCLNAVVYDDQADQFASRVRKFFVM